MRAAWIIGLNFMREQRWFIALMMLYIVGLTGLMFIAGDGRDQETLFIIKNESVYGIFFAVVVAVSLFQNERKTRRIIAVLAKAVARHEYVAGAILGVNLTTAVFFAGVFASIFVLFPHAALGGAVVMIVHMLVACLLASIVTVFYSTFLHPLLATGASGLTLTLPLALERYAHGPWTEFLPVYTLVRHALAFTPEGGLGFDSWLIGLALLESVALWLVSAWTFALRDITTPVE